MQHTRARTLAPALTAALVLACGRAETTPEPELRTVAEQSGFQRTGRYTEVERLCADYQRAWPDAVRCFEFGRTPEGRRMLAIAASRTGALTASAARERDLPVMLFQAGIHAGEIDGKDAGFLALRDFLQERAAPEALQSSVLVFVPVFNVDGHERFGRFNRPNQTGPEEMGWRTTAQNLNLNRDYVKADAPEMHAMLRLLTEWDPILYVDLHVTDGAQFEHDVSNTAEPVYVGDPQMQPAGRALLAELNGAMTRAGSLPIDFYPDLVTADDPASGFYVAANAPRFSTGYWPLRNRFALLVETHSWKDYPTRVRTTHRALITLAEMLARRGSEWRTLALAADQRAATLAGREVPLAFRTGTSTTTIDFRGYAYTRQPSPISGSLATRYDPSRAEVWRVPLRNTVEPAVVASAPQGGYVVPAAHAATVGEKLSLHDITFQAVDQPRDAADVESFRAQTVTLSSSTFEGRTTATITGQWHTERRSIPAGSIFVPIAQRNARLLMTLLEPTSPDSLAAWGFFNNAFERKEYMEGYVAEQVAQEMLKDSSVAAEFQKRLAADPQFAASPAARLDFFYRRHPSFDERFNLYPVYRTAAAP